MRLWRRSLLSCNVKSVLLLQLKRIESGQHGWFRDNAGAQIVLSRRTLVARGVFCVGH